MKFYNILLTEEAWKNHKRYLPPISSFFAQLGCTKYEFLHEIGTVTIAMPEALSDSFLAGPFKGATVGIAAIEEMKGATTQADECHVVQR